MNNILIWNVRGLNNNLRISEVQEAIREHTLGLIGLVETRVREINSTLISSRISPKWNFIHNYSSNHLGRI